MKHLVKYIAKKLVVSIVILLVVSFLAFWIMSVLPGDAALISLGTEATAERIEELREEWGLNDPLPERYGAWLWDILHGDFGYSTHYKTACSEVLAQRMPITLLLGLISLVISVVFGILFGLVAALYRGRILDTIVTFFANLGVSLPVFWLGILLTYLFAVWLRILPVQGYQSPAQGIGGFLYYACLPCISMAWGSIATICRQTRSAVLETLHQSHVKTARAKGLSEGKILSRHVLKNSLIPVITLLGFQVRNLVGGSVVVEQIYNIPGMGRTLIQAVNSRDTDMALACLMIIAAITILSSLLVDIAYGIVDPRIRRGGSQ